MHIDHVRISNLRNLSDIAFDPCKKFNLFAGENGSGKSSVIEAIHYLGYGRSFRTRTHENVIKHQASSFSVFCTMESNEGRRTVGLERSRSNNSVKIDGDTNFRLTDLVALLPISIFSPQSNEILAGQPQVRRKLLDWGLFHVEQSFSALVNKFQAVLQQRNAMLKSIAKGISAKEELDYWDELFADYAESISERRSAYCCMLNSVFQDISKELLPGYKNLNLEYSRGWDMKVALYQQLQEKRNKEVLLGYSLVGPHKSELKIQLNGKNAIETLSRGEQRMLIAGIIAAQQSCLVKEANKQSILLLDDLSAELDSENKKRFLDYLSGIELQTFITAIDANDFSSIKSDSEKKMFHVEHGHVTEE